MMHYAKKHRKAWRGSSVHSHFDAALSSLGPFEPAPQLAVAVSGGADSMALTLLADQWARARGGSITALTVDHRLRAESASEAQQVAAWLRARRIAHHILTPTHTPAPNNRLAAAREWRYHALTDWCARHQLLHLLIAHHQDDQAETHHLMRARGDGTQGEAGMPCVRNHQGVRLLRPLLGSSHETLEHYLQQQSQPWIQDPSNQDTRYNRVRARRHFHAHPEEKRAALQACAVAAKQRAREDDAHARACYACLSIDMAARSAVLHMQALRALEPMAACRVLADCLRALRGTHTRPRMRETQRLYHGLMNGQPHHTLHGYKITLQADGNATCVPEAKGPVNRCAPSVPIAPSCFWA
jgi:tRNA(Ile)-lysidine synthase